MSTQDGLGLHQRTPPYQYCERVAPLHSLQFSNFLETRILSVTMATYKNVAHVSSTAVLLVMSYSSLPGGRWSWSFTLVLGGLHQYIKWPPNMTKQEMNEYWYIYSRYTYPYFRSLPSCPSLGARESWGWGPGNKAKVQDTVEPPKTESPYYRNLHNADKSLQSQIIPYTIVYCYKETSVLRTPPK